MIITLKQGIDKIKIFTENNGIIKTKNINDLISLRYSNKPYPSITIAYINSHAKTIQDIEVREDGAVLVAFRGFWNFKIEKLVLKFFALNYHKIKKPCEKSFVKIERIPTKDDYKSLILAEKDGKEKWFYIVKLMKFCQPVENETKLQNITMLLEYSTQDLKNAFFEFLKIEEISKKFPNNSKIKPFWNRNAMTLFRNIHFSNPNNIPKPEKLEQIKIKKVRKKRNKSINKINC